MRYAVDLPRRVGRHGVFVPGYQAGVFALIDEAWQRAQNSGLYARQDRGRSVYNISMGRKVGYLGESEGARVCKPALAELCIVFETGSKNIVTAFSNQQT